LTDVSFLDSSGVGALLTARRDAHAREVAFRVRHPQPDVLRVLEITNVWPLLTA
jgi:anti-anti-sigma factor